MPLVGRLGRRELMGFELSQNERIDWVANPLLEREPGELRDA